MGITEDEYYNKPMWSWARIDYSINEYKTYEKTREACMKKGEELFQEGYGYSCTSINSYSGKYLGEMLKTFWHINMCFFYGRRCYYDKKNCKNKFN